MYALWYLGRCQSRLHPEMGEEASSGENATESADALDDRTSQTDEQQTERMVDMTTASPVMLRHKHDPLPGPPHLHLHQSH
jgi:hypothetical protein